MDNQLVPFPKVANENWWNAGRLSGKWNKRMREQEEKLRGGGEDPESVQEAACVNSDI